MTKTCPDERGRERIKTVQGESCDCKGMERERKKNREVSVIWIWTEFLHNLSITCKGKNVEQD